MIAMYGVWNFGWTCRMPVGQLPVLPHREREPRHPDQARVRRDDEDHRRQHPDVVAQDVGEGLRQPEVLHDPEDRVVGEFGAENGAVVARGVLGHRHCRERHDRDQHVEHEDGDHHQADAARDRPRGIARLLGHVRDRLDPRVGDHPHGDPEREVPPARRDAQVDVVDQDVRAEHEDDPDAHQDDLGAQVPDGEDQVEPGGLLRSLDVQRREDRDDHDAAEDVSRAVAERRPEDAQVVRHEERRDGDRDHVIEHLRPGRDERCELVERVPGEAGGPAGLRVHDRRLRVGGRGEGEDHARDHERDRRQPEGERRGDAERVVDRRADVPVRRREQRAGAVHTTQRFLSGMPLSHGCSRL